VELEELIVLGVTAGSLAAVGSVLAWVFYTRFFIRVPPNRALVLYGGSRSAGTGPTSPDRQQAEIRPPRIVVGGRAFVAPWNRGVAYLSLSPVEVELTVRSLHSREGGDAAGWAVELALQAKVPADGGLLAAAAENLLGRGEEEVRTLLRQTAEGAIPAILARLHPDAAEPDWERLGSEIQAAVAADLVALGLVVQHLSVKQLTRISGGVDRGSSKGARAPHDRTADPTVEGGDRSAPEFDVRVARLERSVGVLGAQVDRIAQEGRSGTDDRTTASPFDPSLGFPRRAVLGAPSRQEPRDDSTGDGRPSRTRAPPPREGPTVEGRRAARAPLDVEEEG
jgi:flotillin